MFFYVMQHVPVHRLTSTPEPAPHERMVFAVGSPQEGSPRVTTQFGTSRKNMTENEPKISCRRSCKSQTTLRSLRQYNMVDPKISLPFVDNVQQAFMETLRGWFIIGFTTFLGGSSHVVNMACKPSYKWDK